MYKKELRLHYLEERKQLSSRQIEEYSIAIANNALPLPIWELAFYHIFLSSSTKREINTEPLLAILQGKDKHVVVPRMEGHRTLKNFLLTDGMAFRENRFGIPEPVNRIAIPENQLEVVFVPLLAFDETGNRVGYGGGYYDVLLNKCSPQTIKIGLSFFGPIPLIQDCSDTDVPLDYCITPEKVFAF